jgi:hypothetical protein
VAGLGDAGPPTYENLWVSHVGQSLVRIVPKGSGFSDGITAYSIRTDRAELAQTFASNVGPTQVLHNVQGKNLEILAAGAGNSFVVYTLDDNSNSPGFTGPYPLYTGSLPVGATNVRATMADTGPTSWVGILGYQDSALNQFKAGLLLASTTAGGTYTEVCPGGSCKVDQWPVGDNGLTVIGADAYRFIANNFPSPTPAYQWHWSTDPTAFKSETRSNIGNGVFPVSSIALDPQGTQQLLAATAQTNADGGFAGLSLSVASIPAASFFTFTSQDLKPLFSPTLGDTFGFNAQPAIVAYPNRLAVLAQGGLPSSTGVNFWLFDAAARKILAQKTGTGQNLLQGKTSIKLVAMDFAPDILGNTAFDVAWVERVTPASGPPYDAIYYQLLQCAN